MTSRNYSAEPANHILEVERLPARLRVEEVATLLGFQKHDIPVLISKKLLTPLGKPTLAANKYFATIEILEHVKNLKWLHRATRAIYEKWKSNNSNRREADEGEFEQETEQAAAI